MFKFFKKTVNGLTKTQFKIKGVLAGFSGKKYLNDDDLEYLEETLLHADLGWEIVEEILDELNNPELKELSWEDRFYEVISTKLNADELVHIEKKVIILVGINGTGKTTSAAKLAGYFSKSGEKTQLVAADTYRAAAVEQIRTWADRLDVDLVANENTQDPAAVAYDGVTSGMAKKMDRIIVDTAGRLHTSPNLMKELNKIYRIVKKVTDDISVIITLDASTGQNGLLQAREFNKYLPLDAVILTKMDGTARGGIAISVMRELSLPVLYLGVGEKVDDLIPFNRNAYLTGLIGKSEGVHE